MGEAASLGPVTPPLRDTSAVLERITDRLAARHATAFSRATVAAYVAECADRLVGRARVGTHVPVLIERFADQRLGAVARGSELRPRPVPVVLFVCPEDAGRSQLAAALMRRRAAGAVKVLTAGSESGDDAAPMVLRLLAEQRLGVGLEYPKPLTPEVIAAADAVVTLGCEGSCPVVPGRRYLDWHLPDLAGLDIESARSVRDALGVRIDRLVRELLDAATAAPPGATTSSRLSGR
jgi:arsenate reductase